MSWSKVTNFSKKFTIIQANGKIKQGYFKGTIFQFRNKLIELKALEILYDKLLSQKKLRSK